MTLEEQSQSTAWKYFLGLDVGSISIKIALLDASGELVYQAYERHYGRPYVVMARALKEMSLSFKASEVRVPVVTGSAAGELAGLLAGEAVGEIMALTLAAAQRAEQPMSLVDIGGEDTKVLWFQREQGQLALADFAMNAMCAAGTGSFIDQQSHRLGYKVEEFGPLALKSEIPPRVAGRCSVFAKSDMIHLQQSATPDYEIIYGLCLAMARSIKSGLAKGKNLPTPILFTGGVAANPGLARALKEVMSLGENELIIPETHFVFGALGAAIHARQSAAESGAGQGLDLSALEEFLNQGHRPPERLASLKRPSSYPSATSFDWSRVSSKIPVYIGVDVGSVSTNVVLVAENGQLVSRQYLPTAGRPLEAITKGFSGIPEAVRDKVEVKGVCTTGSGRYLSADYLGADMTVNEITAQATAAVAIDPKVDTIFEIGGQDSKYISISDGVIVDFMMNKACAAGTGSFLEEQAEKLGLKIKGEFGEAALSSPSPVSLGERCTVFMESDLVHHQQKGVDHKDLTAGLCYGIVANYLGRVVETRPVGQHIFFQGGTSFNQGVAAAFEARLGRSITVPDNADVTGAMGAALIARDRRDWKESRFVGFDLSTRPYEIKSFECRECANRCEIRKVTVDGGKPFFYGSRCGKFEEDAGGKKEPKWADMFEYRAEIVFNPPELQEVLAEKRGLPRPKVGMIRSMFFGEMGPFWSIFWASLGYEPVWSQPTNKTIIHQGCERVGSEFCFPIKAAHGHLLDLAGRDDIDYIFLPSVVNLPSGGIGEDVNVPDSAACPYVQSLAYTAPAVLGLGGDKFISGPVFFGEGEKVLSDSLFNMVQHLGQEKTKVIEAMRKGLEAQNAFSRRLVEKGREMLAQLGPDDKAMVIVARPYNGFDPGLNLRLNQKLADLGVMGLPMDMLPLNTNEGEAASHYWRYGQKITAAAELIAGDKRLEALYISNFGCGPDSFIIHFFKHQLAGKPFLEIEVDEHSSDVGAVTRLEAFLDSLAARKARGKEVQRRKAAPPLSVTRAPQADKTVYLPPMCDHVIGAAAALRSVGLNAIALPGSDRDTIDLGRSQTSGKECYPLVLTVGDFIKLTKTPGFDPAKSSVFMPSSNGPCRFGQYGRYIRMVMKRMGLEELDVVSLDQTGGMYKALDAAGGKRGGESLSRKFWRALVATDFLQKALWHTRPRENAAGAADAAYQTALADLTVALESSQPLLPVMRMARERFEVARDRHLAKNTLPRVGLVGEIYVRHNAFANEDLIRRLEALGAEVVAPPFSEWIFYVGFVNSMRAARSGDWKKRLKNSLIGWVQARDLGKLASAWNGFFPDGAIEPPIKEVIDLGERFLDRSFQGEAILSLGKGMEFYHHQASGLVNIMPFTCMPGMVVGGLTPNFREACDGMPSLNLSFDGQSQTNTQARLEAFMYQVKSFQQRRLG